MDLKPISKSGQTAFGGGIHRNGLRWCMEGLAVPEAAEHKTIMIDATYLKAHRTASSLRVKKGVRAA